MGKNNISINSQFIFFCFLVYVDVKIYNSRVFKVYRKFESLKICTENLASSTACLASATCLASLPPTSLLLPDVCWLEKRKKIKKKKDKKEKGLSGVLSFGVLLDGR